MKVILWKAVILLATCQKERCVWFTSPPCTLYHWGLAIYHLSYLWLLFLNWWWFSVPWLPGFFFSFLFTPCFLPSLPLLFLHPPVSLFPVYVLCGLGLNLSLGVVYGHINRHCCGILGAIRNLVEALVMMCDVGRALAGGRDMHGELVFMRARQLTFSCRILRNGKGDVCVINCVKPWRLITPLCFSSHPTLLSLSCHSAV